MKHGKKGRKFGREIKQREALMKSLAISLIRESKIVTTSAKAKGLRTYIEKMITKSKNPNVATMRMLSLNLDKASVTKMVKEIAPKYKERPGGYTRIINANPRNSDGARMAIIELV